MEGHLTAKSDVYSFGVVLLEILSGKKAIDKNRPTGEQSLVGWSRPYLTSKRRVFRVLDSRLEGQYSLTRALKVANLALQCLAMDPKSRPTMDEVVTALEQLQESKDTAKTDTNKDQQLNRLSSQSSSELNRSCRSSSEETPRAASYPRPSASLRSI